MSHYDTLAIMILTCEEEGTGEEVPFSSLIFFNTSETQRFTETVHPQGRVEMTQSKMSMPIALLEFGTGEVPLSKAGIPAPAWVSTCVFRENNTIIHVEMYCIVFTGLFILY